MTTDTAEASASIDAVFEVLSDPYRRHALYYLRDRDSTTVAELTTVLAGWLRAREDQTAVATPEYREAVRISLRHAHLPRLAEGGFVRYDPDSGEIALGELPDLLETVLDRSLGQQRKAAGAFDRTDSTNRRTGT